MECRGRGRRRDSLTFSGAFLVSFHQGEVRGADSPLASFIQSPHRGPPRLAARPEQPLRQACPPPPPGLVFPSCGGWAWGWGARRVGAQLGPEKSPRLRWDWELSREVAGGRARGGERWGGGGEGSSGAPPHPLAGEERRSGFRRRFVRGLSPPFRR